MIKKIKKGFTLAEILITLTVVGIVAAIAIPSLNQSVNEKAWKTQKKALHVRLTNAIVNMPKIKGYGVFETVKENNVDVVKTDTLAESFIVDGLSKIYKMSNICDSNSIDKCGLPSKLTTQKPNTIDFPTQWDQIANVNWKYKAAAFQTVNGESVAVFYNPNCMPTGDGVVNFGTYDRVCVNFVYDLNGTKPPNQVGKDIGIITALYREELSIVSPHLYEKQMGEVDFATAQDKCKSIETGLRLPTVEEGIAIVSTFKLLNPDWIGAQNYWSSSVPVGSTTTVYGFGNNNSADTVYEFAKAEKRRTLCLYE